uniref:Uncharacterized protein n=1 Tax=Dicentrarchus labrax TaxID=13489 RepID=A0A8C4EF94_DICLA
CKISHSTTSINLILPRHFASYLLQKCTSYTITASQCSLLFSATFFMLNNTICGSLQIAAQSNCHLPACCSGCNGSKSSD